MSDDATLLNGDAKPGLAALDDYLARCVKAALRSQTLPPWLDGCSISDTEIADRVSLHGISLLLVDSASNLTDWPKGAATRVKDEARQQSFWELSHHKSVALLCEALNTAGVQPVVTKGTSLAYSLYPNPAIRRRGDSDILVPDGDRDHVRDILRQCGFSPCEDDRPLQESWQIDVPPNFNHVIDMHWRVNASAAISKQVEAGRAGIETIDLPRLSPNSKGAAPLDNLILTSINRSLHVMMGYVLGDEKLFECDRLIWAVDMDLLCASFGEHEWDRLADHCTVTGASSVVLSGLAFARDSLDTPIPQEIFDRLADSPVHDDISSYVTSKSAFERFKLDLAASPTMTEKLRLIYFKAFPGSDVLYDRYPDAQDWPVAALRARRLVSGLGGLLRGGSKAP